ncbi:hypothetical protein [Bartonella sp. B30(2025)]
MKPSDFKAVASSSMQEGDVENESLEGASANLEEDREFTPEELKDVIAGLESDIADGSWIRADYALKYPLLSQN